MKRTIKIRRRDGHCQRYHVGRTRRMAQISNDEKHRIERKLTLLNKQIDESLRINDPIFEVMDHRAGIVNTMSDLGFEVHRDTMGNARLEPKKHHVHAMAKWDSEAEAAKIRKNLKAIKKGEDASWTKNWHYRRGYQDALYDLRLALPAIDEYSIGHPIKGYTKGSKLNPKKTKEISVYKEE